MARIDDIDPDNIKHLPFQDLRGNRCLTVKVDKFYSETPVQIMVNDVRGCCSLTEQQALDLATFLWSNFNPNI